MGLKATRPALTHLQITLSLLIFGVGYLLSRNYTMGTDWAYDGMSWFPLLLFEREGVCLFLKPYTANRFLCVLQAGFFCLFPLWAWRGRFKVAKSCVLGAQITLWFTLDHFLASWASFPVN